MHLLHIRADCLSSRGSRPTERQVVLFSAQTAQSAGNERRAGPGVADVGTGESLAFLGRWDGVQS